MALLSPLFNGIDRWSKPRVRRILKKKIRRGNCLLGNLAETNWNNFCYFERFPSQEFSMTRNQIILTKQSGRVTKILTASRILQISIALCQIKAKIHSFPTMYIIGGGKFGLTRWKKCLKPKRSPKNSCFGGNESQLHNFGRVWDPNFLRWPQFGGYPRKATCLSFKMSYVQGP